MSRTTKGVLAFALVSLCGPLTVVAAYSYRTFPLNAVLDDFVLLLWPFWIVTLYESVWGISRAMLVACALNIVAYSVFGLIVAQWVKSKWMISLAYLIAFATLFSAYAYMSGGFTIAAPSIVAAAFVLAVPFLFLFLLSANL
jgi:hypothetical protein